MAQHDVDQAAMRRYLVGTLTAELQREFEERILTEPDFLEELEVEETELIDDYLAGKLSEDERQRFEQHFLATPERQQNLRFSRTLRRYLVATTGSNTDLAPTPSTGFWRNQTPGLRLALPFALVVIVAGVFWLYRSQTSQPSVLATLNLTISVDNRRDAGVEVPKVNLRPNIDVLKLSLRLPEGTTGAVRYRLTLDNVDSANANPVSLEPVGQNAQSLSIVISAGQLVRGRYALKVFAIQSDGTERRIAGAAYFDVE